MRKLAFFTLICISIFFLLSTNKISAQNIETHIELKAKVVDNNSNKLLIFADVGIKNTNISTVTNSDGEFLLKIPQNYIDGSIIISHLGYEKKEIKISSVKKNERIVLNPVVTELDEVSIVTMNKSARELVIEALSKKSSIYNDNNALMTAFYRETIKKRRKNASLSEAVVKIHKQPYNSYRSDNIELIKARKKTDYAKLDTIALKLQGGPFSNLHIDIIKYPEFVFTEDDVSSYSFSFDQPTKINQKLIYVVNFKQISSIKSPLYYGKLYIDAETLALTNAVYNLNVSNKELASSMYVCKKPKKVDVYPTLAAYRVNYRIQNRKWHYAYSNISLTFKVNWKGKLFNDVYTLNSEMAITDWEISDPETAKTRNQFLRSSTILSEKSSGFSDPRFWGKYNIIEPEKSIESAIEKIKKQLKRT